MTLRWGFKREAEAIGREIRSELGLQASDPLDPCQLARHLDIPIVPLSGLRTTASGPVQYLFDVEPEAFSAVTVFRGVHRTIVHNDAHSSGRQASNVTHEASHGLLLHPPTPALDDRGCRIWDQVIEEEATWLAGVLLVPESAALIIARRGTPLAVAAAEFGVSEQMMDWRLNVTGARLRRERARRRRVV